MSPNGRVWVLVWVLYEQILKDAPKLLDIRTFFGWYLFYCVLIRSRK